jgi:hypothetical protein
MEWALALAAGLGVLGALGAWIAKQKRRGPIEGFILGFLFGPLGVVIEALLPAGTRDLPTLRPLVRPEPQGDYVPLSGKKLGSAFILIALGLGCLLAILLFINNT